MHGASREDEMTAKDAVAAYVAAWNETAESKRAEWLDHCWGANATYEYPQVPTAVRGVAALSAFLTQVRARFPENRVAVKGEVHEHHGHFLFQWTFPDSSGASPFAGVDYGRLDAAGRIGQIVGFFPIAD